MGLPLQREADLQRNILQLLRLKGILAWRQNQGGLKAEYHGKKRFVRFASMPGISDIIGVLPGGRFLAIEVKRPGEVPTVEQTAFLDMVRANGGFVVIATSLDGVIRKLEEVGL